MREALSSNSSLDTTASATRATAARGRGRRRRRRGRRETRERAAAAAASIINADEHDDIPIVSAVAVSESRIQAEEYENRLQRSAAAEAAQQAAEAERQDHEVRLVQLERQLAAVLPTPHPPPQQQPQQTRSIFIRHDDDVEFVDDDDDDDDDEGNKKQQDRHQQQVVDTVNDNETTKVEDVAIVDNNNNNNNKNGRKSSPQRHSQSQEPCGCWIVVGVAVLIAVAVVARLCWMATARTRSHTILHYINSITLSGRTLKYWSFRHRPRAEWRAVQWLIKDDLGTSIYNQQSLRQRYALATLWFLQSAPAGFGGGGEANDYKASWTTNLDECEWHNVVCDGNGRVTALILNGNEKNSGPYPP